MKLPPLVRVVIVAVVLASAVTLAAYRYLCFAAGEGVKGFVHFSVTAMEDVQRRMPDLDYALHYDAEGRAFAVKPRASSSISAHIKDADLGAYMDYLSPRPSKLVVLYETNAFATPDAAHDFERRTREVLETPNTTVVFLKGTTTQAVSK